MKTIRVELDSDLLKETDRAARRAKVSRSTLIRRALRSHLRRLDIRELEERDRTGHRANRGENELSYWEKEAAWPPR